MAIQEVWDEELQEWVYDDPDIDEKEADELWKKMTLKSEDVDFSEMTRVSASPSVLEAMIHGKKVE